MTTFFIPSKKCYCKDHLHRSIEYGFYSITLLSNHLICFRSCKTYHYSDEFTLVLGFLLLKKFNKKDVKEFLDHFPWFEKYDYKWVWDNLPFYKFIDENRSCFLKLLGLPSQFSPDYFIFDNASINLILNRDKKKKEYKFTDGEPIKLGQIPQEKKIKKIFV